MSRDKEQEIILHDVRIVDVGRHIVVVKASLKK